MMYNDKVSVVIPVYNVEPSLLADTITAVVGQLEKDQMEIIIVDDNSKVNYEDTIAKFPKDLVIYHRNPENIGMVANWNLGVRKSTGKYVAVVGHDDKLKGGMFKAYLQQFQDNPEIVLCSCAREFIDVNGEVFVPKRHANDRRNIYLNEGHYYLDFSKVIHLCLRNGNAIGEPSCVMFKRECYNQVGGYDPAIEHAADLDLDLAVAKQGVVCYINYPYLQRRLHESNLTIDNVASGKVARDRVNIYEKYSKYGDPGNDKKYRAYISLSAYYDLFRGLVYKKKNLVSEAYKTLSKYGFMSLEIILLLYENMVSKNRDAF